MLPTATSPSDSSSARRAQEGREGDVTALERRRLVKAGQGEQVLDEALDPRHLGQHDALDSPHLLGRRSLAAGQHLKLPADRGERRAQLVGGVGDELALAREGVVKAVQHVVEGLGEGPHLDRRSRPRRRCAGVSSPASTAVAVAAMRRNGAAVRAASR